MKYSPIEGEQRARSDRTEDVPSNSTRDNPSGFATAVALRPSSLAATAFC
jgi:hypothetical protein